MSDKIYFAKPDYGTVDVGSIVWYFNFAKLLGPFHVIEIRHGGYGNGSIKKWILFDASKNAYHTARYEHLRVPKEIICTDVATK